MYCRGRQHGKIQEARFAIRGAARATIASAICHDAMSVTRSLLLAPYSALLSFEPKINPAETAAGPGINQLVSLIPLVNENQLHWLTSPRFDERVRHPNHRI
jgi:hypothetical protein